MVWGLLEQACVDVKKLRTDAKEVNEARVSTLHIKHCIIRNLHRNHYIIRNLHRMHYIIRNPRTYSPYFVVIYMQSRVFVLFSAFYVK